MQADVIHVMEDGRIVESGTHDDLIATTRPVCRVCAWLRRRIVRSRWSSPARMSGFTRDLPARRAAARCLSAAPHERGYPASGARRLRLMGGGSGRSRPSNAARHARSHARNSTGCQYSRQSRSRLRRTHRQRRRHSRCGACGGPSRDGSHRRHGDSSGVRALARRVRAFAFPEILRSPSGIGSNGAASVRATRWVSGRSTTTSTIVFSRAARSCASFCSIRTSGRIRMKGWPRSTSPTASRAWTRRSIAIFSGCRLVTH